jgi:uncharacterized protein Smg (DUF494 family)
MIGQSTHSQTHFLDVVVMLATEMLNCKTVKEIEVSKIAQHGYTQGEISSGISWLLDKISLNTGTPVPPVPAPRSIRVLDHVERELLSRDAQGYLIQLHQLSVLSQTEFEEILDRVLLCELPSAGVAEVKMIAASVLFGSEDARNNGSRLMLNAGDTVQ